MPLLNGMQTFVYNGKVLALAVWGRLVDLIFQSHIRLRSNLLRTMLSLFDEAEIGDETCT